MHHGGQDVHHGAKAVGKSHTVASRWQQDVRLVLKHLLKKQKGELAELEGHWCRGEGDIPDALFDAQYATQQEDFQFCKGLDSVAGIQRSKYNALRQPLAPRDRGRALGLLF